MKAILVSKRFNPGHVSHLEANAKLLEANGFDVRFLVNRKFHSFADCSIKGKETGFFYLLKLRKGDLFIVWFPSVSVVFNLIFVRLFTQATTVYVYHEPYTSFSSYRDAGFNWLKALRVTAISWVSQSICRLSNKIILPSARAFNAIPKAKVEPKRYAKINLIFADESTLQTTEMSRNYVSYIGTIAEDHAFDEFVRLMQKCIADQALQPLSFLIATRSQVSEKHRTAIDECLASNRLVLQCGSPMTNGMINHFYSQSFVVWNAYRRSMQSGVLPKAYMFGAPVILSEANQSEYFKDGVHGVMISDRYSFDEFQDAITRLESSWSVMSENCRSYYLQNFDYRSLSTPFMHFISGKS